MPGFEAEKKKNDLALMLSHIHMKLIGKYTVLNDQYSQ